MRHERWLVGLLLGATLILLLGVCDSAGHHQLASTMQPVSSAQTAPGIAAAGQPRAVDPVDGGCHAGNRAVEEHTANKPDGEEGHVAGLEPATDHSAELLFSGPLPRASSVALNRPDPRNLSCVDRR
ncbi:hypothetical protein [Streptomyces sp. NBC_00239]|uniref:hypothetical protein n=1 Tax=Streptomyces sp. NBC_00239 TaxID=2903640 RepID=UPI002E2CA759|nr:hypothetical protein [Streptomyces sp. NBC_00239]